MLHEGGHPVLPADVGIPPDVVHRVTVWLADYSDEKLAGAASDTTWMAEGQALYATLSRLLADDEIELFDWEGLWDASRRP